MSEGEEEEEESVLHRLSSSLRSCSANLGARRESSREAADGWRRCRSSSTEGRCLLRRSGAELWCAESAAAGRTKAARGRRGSTEGLRSWSAESSGRRGRRTESTRGRSGSTKPSRGWRAKRGGGWSSTVAAEAARRLWLLLWRTEARGAGCSSSSSRGAEASGGRSRSTEASKAR